MIIMTVFLYCEGFDLVVRDRMSNGAVMSQALGKGRIFSHLIAIHRTIREQIELKMSYCEENRRKARLRLKFLIGVTSSKVYRTGS